MATNITVAAVKALRAGGRIRDSKVQGFQVRRQTENSRAIYSLAYRFNDRQKVITIGADGSPWTPDTARAQALKLLAMIKDPENPKDPSAERTARGEIPTLKEFVPIYIEGWCKTPTTNPRNSVGTIDEKIRSLNKRVVPILGDKRLHQITGPDCAKLHLAMNEAPVAANRMMNTLSDLFNFAEYSGVIKKGGNPVTGNYLKNDEYPREVEIDDTQLAGLGSAMIAAGRGYTDDEWSTLLVNFAASEAAAKEDGDEDEPTGTAVVSFAARSRRIDPEDHRAMGIYWMLLFTGARLGEVQKMEWSWINFELGFARIPKKSHKTGRKMGVKVLALPPLALRILSDLPREPADKYVFPGNKAGRFFRGVQKPWQRIRALAGLPKLRLHDLRHVYGMTAGDNDETALVIKDLLGHSAVAMTERYIQRRKTQKVVGASDRTATAILHIMQVSPSPAPAEMGVDVAETIREILGDDCLLGM